VSAKRVGEIDAWMQTASQFGVNALLKRISIAHRH